MNQPTHSNLRIAKLSAITVLILCLCLKGQEQLPPSAEAPDYADLDLEQLMEIRVDSVYGASRYEQTLSKAPSSVSIITANDIEKYGYRNLEDILRSVRGIYITSDRNYSNIGVRGFNRPGDYNSRVIFLVDGHRINDNLYDSALLGFGSVIDVDLIQRIEIIRGPSSSVYGSNALLGVINIIPKTGADIDGIEVSGKMGTFETYQTRLTYGKQLTDDIELLLSGTLYDSAGDLRWYDPYFDERISANPLARNRGVAENSDGEQAYQFSGNLKIHDFTISAAYTDRVKDVPTGSFDTLFNEGKEETSDIRGYIDLVYNKRFSDDLSIMGRIAYDYYKYEGTYPYGNEEPPPSVILNEDTTAGQWTTAELQATKVFADRHTLVLGADFRKNFEQFQQNFDRDPYYEYLNDDHTSHSFGVYGQIDLSVSEDLFINAGLRYDYYSLTGGETSPRLGVVYTPWETSTFKLLYGQAFRVPNGYEQHYESADDFKANPNLGPETIRTYEFIYEHAFSDNVRLSFSAYHYEIADLITQTIDPVDEFFTFENTDSATADGLELELETRFDNGFTGRTSYAIQHAEDDQTGDRLSNSPKHLAKLNLIVPLFEEKAHAGIELQYNSSSETVSGRTISGFFITNATLFSSHIAENLEISATIYNLFDQEYEYPVSPNHSQEAISQDGRAFGFKLTYRF